MNDADDLDNQDAGAGSGRAGGDPTGGVPLDGLIGAYLLDALTEEERAAFEAHLLASEAAQREVAQLRPVVELLPLTLDDVPTDAEAEPGPSVDLRHRILTAARADGVEAADGAEPVGPTAPPGPRRIDVAEEEPLEPIAFSPTLRQRGGTAPPLGGVVPLVGRIGWARLAAAVLALVAAGSLIWALVLQNRLDEREDELAAIEQTATAAAGEAVLALTYVLTPTDAGPETANGVLFPLPTNPDIANLNVLGMPPPPEGQAYQLWFVQLDPQGDPAVAIPSVTFGVDEDGNGSAEVPLTDQPFDIVAITQEPAGGSETHTPPILMTGAPGTAAG